jgi:hypothetical protein
LDACPGSEGPPTAKHSLTPELSGISGRMNHFPDISKMVSGAAQILPNHRGQNRAKPAFSGPICL